MENPIYAHLCQVSVKFHTFNFYLRRYKIGVDIKLINEILFNLQKSTSLGQLVIKFRKIKRKNVFTLQKSEKEWLIVRGHMTSTPNREA